MKSEFRGTEYIKFLPHWIFSWASMSRQTTFKEAGENYLHIRYRALPVHTRQLSQSNKREV